MRVFTAVAAALLLAGCGTKKSEETKAVVSQPAPETYRVNFDTSRGAFVIEVSRAWAPLGADRFHDLVEQKFFDGARFFRVVPNFMVQFGLAADPATTKKWDGSEFPDDPVTMHNTRGTISFATRGPRTRTTQVFINFGDNTQSLDPQGFSPFGRVVSGMDVVDKIYPGYGEQPDQGRVTAEGNAYVEKQFPQLDYIRTARVAK